MNRVFELRIYHTMPGKLAALKSRFGTTTSDCSPVMASTVIGFWVHDDDRAGDNSFIFLVAHDSREASRKALGGDDGGPCISGSHSGGAGR